MKTLPTSCYHNCKNGRLRQTKQCSTLVVQLASFSQSLLASAQDTQAAGDIFASAIGAIVSELLTQALATKMGSFKGH